MKRLIAAFFAFALLFARIDSSCVLAADGTDIATAWATEAKGISAGAYVLIDAVTGEVISERASGERRLIASTTKILTALITLEQKELDREFVVDKGAIMVEGTSMGLREGDKASLRTLAVGMLLASGNDAANAAAVRISGSIPTFAQKMNEYAKEIGMVNSSFANPSGLNHESHFSTAYDMSLLARKALQNKEFAGICKSKSISVRVTSGELSQRRRYSNHNKLLNIYEGCIGIKTGFTKKAGRCLVSAAKRDDVTLICVTLNAGDDWNDHKKLFDYGFSQRKAIEHKAVLEKTQLEVVGGQSEQVALSLGTDCFLTTASADIVESKTVLPHFLYAPIKKGEVIGYIEHSANGFSFASTPIVAGEDVAQSIKQEKSKENGFFKWLDSFFGKYFKTV